MSRISIARYFKIHPNIFLAISLTLFLAGCGAGKTLILNQSETKVSFVNIGLLSEKSTAGVPEDIQIAFKDLLHKKLYEELKFNEGSDLTIAYRFIQYNPGSQLSRWFWGGIGNAGEGTLTIEARFLDPNKKELAKIQSEGKIGSGFFGGTMDLALDKAATEIGEYTARNFR